jgi:hypothetical protein
MPSNRPYPDCPLVVAYGLGVDSTAMLVEFARRGIRPDLILFADTGGDYGKRCVMLSTSSGTGHSRCAGLCSGLHNFVTRTPAI